MSKPIGQLIAERIRKYRDRKGWSVRQLAERCQELGATQLTVGSLTNIERGMDGTAKRGGRSVAADELLVLAYALDVPPILLVVPVGDENDVEVVPGVVVSSYSATAWISGNGNSVNFPGDDPALPETDASAYDDAMKPLRLLAEIVVRGNDTEFYRVASLRPDDYFIEQRHRFEREWEEQSDQRERMAQNAEVNYMPVPSPSMSDEEYIRLCRQGLYRKYERGLGWYAEALRRGAAASITLPPIPQHMYDDLRRLDREARRGTDQSDVHPAGLGPPVLDSPYALPNGVTTREVDDGR